MDAPLLDTAENPTSSDPPAPRKIRWGMVLVWVALFALLGFLALGLVRTQEGPVQPGQPTPKFTLTTFDGDEIQSENLLDQVVVVNFWASWCKPCEQEAADLQTAWEMYQPGGEVVFLGVDYVDTEPEARAYLDKFAITYPNGPDLGTRISQAYRMGGVPETYIIDREGTLVYVKIGPFVSLGEIQAVIDPLLEN